ncbi:hypothetical protein DERP_007665, partial [Dermatophagoides pteronyssinus]
MEYIELRLIDYLAVILIKLSSKLRQTIGRIVVPIGTIQNIIDSFQNYVTKKI